MARYVYRVNKRPLTIEKRAFTQFVNEQHNEEIGQLDIDESAKLELYDETVTFECSYCHEKVIVNFDIVKKKLPKNKDLLPDIRCQYWNKGTMLPEEIIRKD